MNKNQAIKRDMANDNDYKKFKLRLINYLLRMGWSHGDKVFSLNEAIKLLKIKNIENLSRCVKKTTFFK